MLASIISSKRRWSEMLAFSNDYYGFIFRVTQSVELFCTYYMRSIFKVNSGIYIVLSGFEVLGGIIMMFISPDTVKVAAILTGIIFILNAVIDSVILYRIHKIGRHCTEHIQDVVDELNGNIIDEDDVKWNRKNKFGYIEKNSVSEPIFFTASWDLLCFVKIN